MGTWRDIARPIIAECIKEHGKEGPALKKALFEAYPFHERAMWPYKVWLDEIKQQTGRKKRKENKNQLKLFEP